MSNFIHLHTHSDKSPQDGAQTVDQIVNKAKSLGMSAVAITDHGRAGGLLNLYKSCKKNDINPICGIELYVAPENRQLREKLENHTKTSYHLTVLAKNEEGLKNIFRLTSQSWLDGIYYGKARVDFELLQNHTEGLIVLSGCGSSRLSTFLLQERWKEAEAHLLELRDLYKDDFYVEIQNHGLDWQLRLKTLLKTLAEKYDIPIVATQDSHYQGKEDADLHSNICRLNAGDLQFDSDQSYFKSREEMEKMFDESEYHALDITNDIAAKCNLTWDYGKTIWPVYELPEKQSSSEYLRELAYKGFKKLYPIPTQEHIDRIEFELNIIEEMGFPSYFLIVQDFVNWARKNKVPVGPGRGSGVASIVCYCLGITEVDPIKYKLLFSRFLNKSRISLPDLDIDLSKRDRHKVIEYVTNKYGANKLAQIGTYSVFKPRGSLRDFTRIKGYEVMVANELASMVPPDNAGKQSKWEEIKTIAPKLFETKWPDVVELAVKAEGIVRQTGIHASGIIISDKAMSNYLPLFAGKGGELASQFDMKEVETIGLVKFDFLGLKNLTVIEDTLEILEEKGIELNIRKIEDRDEKTYKLFADGILDGIFQFETSSGFKELCRQVKPKCIEDLSAITALHRPGPLNIGLTSEYGARKAGKEFEYDIPELEPILKDTVGILVYQEQIMRICVDLAGYLEHESDNMRRIIGKKIPEEMIKEKEKFISGCIKNNIPKDKAEKLFDDIEGFALYGFNSGHSTAYSFISYRCGYLKAHYPKEFYTALFNNSLDSQDDLIKYTHSARELGIPLALPNVNRSEYKFKLDNGTIVFGLAGIKGVGEKASSTLLESRSKDGYKSIEELLNSNINIKVITALAECGGLDSLLEE